MKKKVIVLFVALLALSWFSSIRDMMSVSENYQELMEKAAYFEEKKVYMDAIGYYQKALDYTPEDATLLMRMAEDYKQIDDSLNYQETLKKVVSMDDALSEQALEKLMIYYAETDEEKAANYIAQLAKQDNTKEYIQQWFEKYRGAYRVLYCHYDEFLELYQDHLLVKSEDGYTVLDATGDMTIQGYYPLIQSYSKEGLILVTDEAGEQYYIDENGLVRINPDEEYQELGIVNDDIIVALKNGKWGYLNRIGEPCTAFDWDGLTAINEGYGFAQKNGKWALVNAEGEEKTEYVFDDVKQDIHGIAFSQERSFVKIDGEYRMIDRKGHFVGDLSFDDAQPFGETGYAAVCKGQKWGFVDSDGKLKIDYQYANVTSFCNGFAAFYQNNMWGFIDQEDQIIMKPQFLAVTPFSTKGTVAVKRLLEKEDDDDEAPTLEWNLVQLYLYN